MAAQHERLALGALDDRHLVGARSCQREQGRSSQRLAREERYRVLEAFAGFKGETQQMVRRPAVLPHQRIAEIEHGVIGQPDNSACAPRIGAWLITAQKRPGAMALSTPTSPAR